MSATVRIAFHVSVPPMVLRGSLKDIDTDDQEELLHNVDVSIFELLKLSGIVSNSLLCSEERHSVKLRNTRIVNPKKSRNKIL